MEIFVAMPLGKKEISFLRPIIRNAVVRAGFSCIFPDEIPGHGAIIADVMDKIAQATAVIVEISKNNPNVIWEYGWASALGKPIFPISKTSKSFFFDTRHNRSHRLQS
jgi:nucleoside 2-deoxyribosyltransferase